MIGTPAPQSSKRVLSEAIYEQIMTDEDAPPSVRLAAAQAYDAIENGRPGTARAVNVDDVSDLSDDQCERLYRALMRRIETRRPGFFNTIIQQIVDQMLVQQAAQAALPKLKKFHFVRGPLAGAGPHVPRWPSAPPAKAISVEMSPKVEEAAYEHAPLPPAHGRQANALSSDASENVVPIKPLAPFRQIWFPTEDLPANSAPGQGDGSIHPHVVYRSTLKDPLAFDTAFFNGRTTKPV